MGSHVTTEIESLFQELMNHSGWIQVIIWLLILISILIVGYLLLSLLFFPLMYLFNRLTDKNQSNPLSKEELLIGELTEKITGFSTGEVMAVDGMSARSLYPAQFYRETEQESGLLLPKGTKVLIVGFNDQGIALVVEKKSI